MFSFEAEKRGAKVTAIDIYQGEGENQDGFNFAKKILKSNVSFYFSSLEDFHKINNSFDIVLLYGTLYHVENPIEHLKALFYLVKDGGYSLIETAIAQNEYGNKNVWEFNDGFDRDSTNFWYCSLQGLKSVLLFIGFKSMEIIYNDKIRATVKALK